MRDDVRNMTESVPQAVELEMEEKEAAGALEAVAAKSGDESVSVTAATAAASTNSRGGRGDWAVQDEVNGNYCNTLRPVTAEEKAAAKLELLRAIAEVYRPTARQVVILLRASGLLKERCLPAAAVAIAAAGARTSLVLGAGGTVTARYSEADADRGVWAAVNAGAVSDTARRAPRSKWPKPGGSSLRLGYSHMVPSSDASWGPPEPQPSQPWGHAGSAASTVAAAAAAIGFYARLEYPPDAEPGSTFSTVLEHLPRKVQLEIHHRLGSSAAVPSNVVTRGDSLGLNFRLRMSDPGDTSVARRMARLSCKAGSEASFSNIAIDGKPEKDIKGSDPRLWSRLWSKAQGRAVLEFHVQCSDKGLACARTTTVQSLWLGSRGSCT
jgi:hypothetical protein